MKTKAFAYRSVWMAVAFLFSVVFSGCKFGFASRNVLHNGQTGMDFSGNLSCNLTSNEILNISWSPAHNADGSVDYKLYSDQNLQNLIADTGMVTNYEWDVSGVPEDKFTVYVTATDSDGTTAPESCAVAYPGGKHSPSAALTGIWVTPAAQDKILVKWDPTSVASDIVTINVYFYADAIYNDQNQNLTKRPPVCSTTFNENFCLVQNLPMPNYQYRFLVRAVNSSNFEDKNTNEGTYYDALGNVSPGGTYTLDHAVVAFSGAVGMANVLGVAGLSTLRMSWLPAQPGSLGAPVTGYFVACNVSNDDIPGPFLFQNKTDLTDASNTLLDTASTNYKNSDGTTEFFVPDMDNGVPLTNVYINGLATNTKYCCNIRAYIESIYTDQYHNSEDENRITVCGTTNSIRAPSFFAGVQSAAPVPPAQGSSQVTKAALTWNSPSADGVESNFLIRYALAPASEQNVTDPTQRAHPQCLQQDLSNASRLYTADSNTFSYTVTGLTTGQKYYFQVNTYYSYVNGSGQTVEVIDPNAVQLCTFMDAPNPVFHGLTTLLPDDGGGASPTNGFTGVNFTFQPSTGSFTQYVLDISTSPNICTRTGRPASGTGLPAVYSQFCTCVDPSDPDPANCQHNIVSISSSQSATGGVVQSLKPYTTYYARAYAVYDNGTSWTQVDGMQYAPLSVSTIPAQPQGEVAQALVLNNQTVMVVWQGPTGALSYNPAGATKRPPLFNGFWVYHSCGTTAQNDIDVQYSLSQPPVQQTGTPGSMTVPSSPNMTYVDASSNATTFSLTFNGLAPNTQCCFKVRAHYKDPNFELYSATQDGLSVTDSSGNKLISADYCVTPQLVPPSWTGLTSATAKPDPSGFSTVIVKFPALATTDYTNFTAFQTDWADGTKALGSPAETTFTWDRTASDASNTWVTTATDTQEMIAGATGTFKPNWPYYFATRAINLASGTSYNSNTGSADTGTYSPNNPPNSYVWNPHLDFPAGFNPLRPEPFVYKTVWMHPPVPFNATSGTGKGTFQLASASGTSLIDKYQAPSNVAANDGLWDTVITIVALSATDVNNVLNGILVKATLGAGQAQQLNFSNAPAGTTVVQMSGKTYNFPSPLTTGQPYLFTESSSDFTASAQNSVLFAGLPSNVTIYVLTFPAYFLGASSWIYTLAPDSIASPASVALSTAAPSLQGDPTVAQLDNATDFVSITINWLGVLGGTAGQTNCSFQVEPANPGESPGQFTGSTDQTGVACDSTNTTLTVTGLAPNTAYYVQMRAIDNSTHLYTDSNKVYFTSAPVQPQGDQVVSAVVGPYTVGQYYPVTLTYQPPSNCGSTPTGAAWNEILLFKFAGASPTDSTLQTKLAQEIAKGINSTSLVATIPVGDGNTNCANRTYTDAPGGIASGNGGILAGIPYEYYMVAAYQSGSTFQLSKNASGFTTSGPWPGSQPPPVQVQKTYTLPSQFSSGVLSISKTAAYLDASLPSDGTSLIKLCYGSAISSETGVVESYYVYYFPTSNLGSFGTPWQIITAGDAKRDAVTSTGCLIAGGNGLTSSGTGNYVVRAHITATTVPSPYVWAVNTSTVDDFNTNALQVTLSPNQANFVYLPQSQTKLGYDLWMMTWEASIANGSSWGSLSVNDDSSDNGYTLYQCNQSFYSASNQGSGFSPFDTVRCGAISASSDYKLVSSGAANSSAAPATGMDWSQAWLACRNSSVPGVALMRMPTEEEWRRVAQWANYSSWTGAYGNSTTCNVGSGSRSFAGTHANCASAFGLQDMAGNVREWVDARVLPERLWVDAVDFTVPFNYPSSGTGPVTAHLVRNGLDSLTRRYHNLRLSGPYALAMGSDYTVPSTPYTGALQYDAQAESWMDATQGYSNVGVRCVANFIGAGVPSMSNLQFSQEPLYQMGDRPTGSPALGALPANRYEGEPRPESVVISVVPGSTYSTGPQGSVTLAWNQWMTLNCSSPPCTTATDSTIDYDIYRFPEPTRQDIRTTVLWGIPGGSHNPYSAGATALNPFAVTGTIPNLTAANSAYKITTVLGTQCTNSYTFPNTPSAATNVCVFTDSSSSGTSFHPNAIYEYLVVAHPHAGGNYIAPRSQRFRSPYFAGPPISVSAPTNPAFRTELRLRKASVMLVDEDYQTAIPVSSGSFPEVMVPVPMDQSGGDHDYFIFKYLGVQPSSEPVTNDSSHVYAPLTSNTGTWSTSPGQCLDAQLRLGNANVGSLCGSDSNTGTFQSLADQNVNVPTSWVQADLFQGCYNTQVVDGNSSPYQMHMMTNQEYTMAADWGDLNLDGTIDYNGYDSTMAGKSISTVEGSYCNTTQNPLQRYPAYTGDDVNFPHCISRTGMRDPVGANYILTVDRAYTNGPASVGVIVDNGMDGLGLGATIPYGPSSGINVVSSAVDLWTGLQWASSSGFTIATNGEQNASYSMSGSSLAPVEWSIGPESNFTGIISGRFTMFSRQNLSYSSSSFSTRCAY